MRYAILSLLLFVLPAVAVPTIEALTEGTHVGPGGVQATCQLPMDLRLKNTGGMGPRGPGTGAGLCVFTATEHCGLWANEPRIRGFQQKMTREPGGGYPEKLDTMMAKYAPGVAYLQHTGGDMEWLRAAMRTRRMVGVTYAGHDMHYGRQTIAHMVNLVHLDDKLACILDNNFPGEKQLVWMTAAEFEERWLGQKYLIRNGRNLVPVGGGWAVVLLNPPPPPKPQP